MPKIIKFRLKKKDYEELRKFLSKGRANARELKRAEVLMLHHKGINGKDIYRTLGVSEGRTRRIRKNYKSGGLKKALFDSSRPGKPKKFSPKDRAKITALACSDAPEGYGRWSLSLLAEKLVELKYVESISKAQVGRILKKTK